MEPVKIYTAPRWRWLLLVVIAMLVGYNYLYTGEWVSNVFLGALGLLACYGFLTDPHTVRLTEDNQVVVEDVLRQKRFNVEDVLAIEYDNRAVTIKYRGGKVRLSQFINHLNDFAAQLKVRNPLIEETEGPMLKLSKSPGKMVGVITLVIALALVVVALAVNFLGH